VDVSANIATAPSASPVSAPTEPDTALTELRSSV
jgi:hypothetical protein